MSRQQPYRVGMIIPSSNTTMETEIPALLRRRERVAPEVDDNVAVGRLDPRRLPGIARELALQSVDAVVLSACVQMPSLEVVSTAEQELGKPVLSAATATARRILLALDLEPTVPDAEPR